MSCLKLATVEIGDGAHGCLLCLLSTFLEVWKFHNSLELQCLLIHHSTWPGFTWKNLQTPGIYNLGHAMLMRIDIKKYTNRDA